MACANAKGTSKTGKLIIRRTVAAGSCKRNPTAKPYVALVQEHQRGRKAHRTVIIGAHQNLITGAALVATKPPTRAGADLAENRMGQPGSRLGGAGMNGRGRRRADRLLPRAGELDPQTHGHVTVKNFDHLCRP